MASRYTAVLYDIPTIIADLSDIECLTAEILSEVDVSGDVSIPTHIEYGRFSGPYEITPRAHEDVVLETNGLLMDDDVTVKKIPYFETSNLSGYTVYIANEV